MLSVLIYCGRQSASSETRSHSWKESSAHENSNELKIVFPFDISFSVNEHVASCLCRCPSYEASVTMDAVKKNATKFYHKDQVPPNLKRKLEDKRTDRARRES